MSSTGAHFIFVPDASNWKTLETALDRSISEPVRKKIETAVSNYFSRQPFERAAPFLNDVVSRVSRIKKAALDLQSALSGTESDDRETQTQVLVRLSEQIDLHGFEPGIDSLDAVQRMITALSFAASDAEQRFEKDAKESGFVEGDAWARLVVKLREIMDTHGLPSGAAQSTDNPTSSDGSPFVRFFTTLQKMFPDDSLRRHSLASPQALARNMNRARETLRQAQNGT